MPEEDISTIGQYLYWSYANLGMAHAALSKGECSYGRLHYVIRRKLYTGLGNGTMKIGSLRDEEKLKLVMPQACCYCGSTHQLSLDHLIPLGRGGKDTADNLVWACRSCNSSKGATDVIEWHRRTGRFPPLLLLRRYLKIVIGYCEDNRLMDVSVEAAPSLPFSLASIPMEFPVLSELRLWIIPVVS